jgi:hypothetical protein
MKFFILSTLLISLGAGAATPTYAPNSGTTPPGTFNEKSNSPMKSKSSMKSSEVSKVEEQQANATTSETGIINSSGVTTDQMNSSPNRAPVTDEEAVDDTTLSGAPLKNPRTPAEIQAQEEEDALDYSTTPQKRTTKPLGPNKK